MQNLLLHTITWCSAWLMFACSSSGAVQDRGGVAGNTGSGGSPAASGGASAGGGTPAVADAGNAGGSSAGGSNPTGSGGSVNSGTGGSIQLTMDGSITLGGGETVCDGIDNDSNGIIDDVDLGQDGICDCLRIATLGRLDTWEAKGHAATLLTTWLDKRSSTSAVHLGDAILTRALLDQYQIVVAMNVATSGTTGGTPVVMHTYQPDEVTAMADWINAGGGLMVTSGYGSGSENANINGVLQPFNMAYGRGAVWNVDVSDWTPHPVTDGISLIRAWNSYEITGTGGISLARHPMKLWDVMRAQEAGAGHIVMWGDEWITYDSEWANLTQYQVERLWQNIFKWLSPPTQCQVVIPPQIL